jgi:putative transposase
MHYSQYKNGKSGRKGHLWQERFYSCVLDEGHLLQAARYVERNPVRAKMVDQPEDYVWSSAREHLGMEQKPILKTGSKEKILKLLGEHQSWRIYLGCSDQSMEQKIREQSQKRKVLGCEAFVKEIELRLGIRLKIGDRPLFYRNPCF